LRFASALRWWPEPLAAGSRADRLPRASERQVGGQAAGAGELDSRYGPAVHSRRLDLLRDGLRVLLVALSRDAGWHGIRRHHRVRQRGTVAFRYSIEGPRHRHHGLGRRRDRPPLRRPGRPEEVAVYRNTAGGGT